MRHRLLGRWAVWWLLVGTVPAGCLHEVTPPVGPRIVRLEAFAPESALLVGHSLQLGVAAWDSLGDLVSPTGLVWRSTDTTLLRVDGTGLAQATMGPGGDVDVQVAAPPSPTVGILRLHVAVPGEVKWRLALGPMPVIGGPAQGPDGTVYMLTYDDPANDISTLHAVSPRGVVLWQRRLAQVRNNHPVVAPDGIVLVVGQFVYAFAPDGSARWILTNRPTGAPGDDADLHAAAVSGDGVLYAAMGFDLFAFRAATGDTLWTGPRVPDAGWLTPPTVSVDERTVYVYHTSDSIYALDAATGQPRWGVPDPDSIYNLAAFGVGPTLDGARLIVPVAEQLQELDTTGTVVALGRNLGLGVSEPAIGPDGTLYVQVPQNDGLLAFGPADVEHWRAPALRPRWTWYGGPALAAGGVLYAATIDGFYALDLSPTGATVRWRFPADTTQRLIFIGAPLIGADGTVYSFTSCTNGEETGPCSDELFAFWADLPPEPNSPWPMWRHDARRSGQAGP